MGCMVRMRRSFRISSGKVRPGCRCLDRQLPSAVGELWQALDGLTGDLGD
jgi:hypothetical protein